jgi:PEP-CTERM motif
MMQTKGFALVLATATVSAGLAVAQPGGQLTSGTAVYIQQTAPNAENLASPTGAVFEPEGVGPNQLFQNWWYYRVSGDTREYPFGTYARIAGGQIAGLSNYVGNTSTYNWTDSDASSVTRFTATYIATLTHGAQVNNATLAQSFQINNPGATTLNIVLFNYADIDANGTTPVDTDTATGNVNAITDMDGPWQVVHSAVGANAYQVGAFSSIRDLLLDTNINNLNNTGLPFGPGDYTGAFQWNLSIPAGQSATVTSALAVSPVPEPGTLLLTGAAALGALAWRRRKKG